MSERVEFCGDFKPAMSLGQPPLAMTSGVSWSGWAMLQRHQDSIRYDCDGGCDNNGVHKRLIFTIIVTWSLTSFHYSAYILVSLLTSWWSSFR